MPTPEQWEHWFGHKSNKERWIEAQEKQLNVDYPEIYRECHDLDSFIELAKQAGGNEDEAHQMYYELTHKYEGR